MNDIVYLIFSGYNQRAVTSFIRTLIQVSIPFAIIAKSNSDSILKSSYRDKVFAIRKQTNLELNDLANCISIVRAKTKANEFIISPSTEALNRFILKYRREFEKLKCIVPLVNNDLYELISDKYSFGEFCSKNDILIPETYQTLDNCIIPFVAKPIRYSTNTGLVNTPMLILNENDKSKFKKNFDQEDFYFQKFLVGESYYLLYYFHRNGNIYKFSQQNIIQQHNGKSILAAIASNIHLGTESVKYEKLFKSIFFHGFVMIEIKETNNGFIMIEANPRFWGPSQLFVDANKNFFKAFLSDYGSLSEMIDFSNDEEKFLYFWFGGIIESYRRGHNLVFHSNYTEKKMFNELSRWLESDIYRRSDTIEIFKYELSKNYA